MVRHFNYILKTHSSFGGVTQTLIVLNANIFSKVERKGRNGRVSQSFEKRCQEMFKEKMQNDKCCILSSHQIHIILLRAESGNSNWQVHLKCV